MEQWKVDIADRIVSWDYLSPKDWETGGGGYYILITCQGNSGVETVSKLMKEHMGSLCADYKNMWFYTGKNSFVKRNNSFAVQVGSTQAQKQLHKNLDKLYGDVEAWRNSQAKQEEKEEAVVEKIKRQNYGGLLIFVALVAALVWVILVWKPKK